jgi:hypothetical protein
MIMSGMRIASSGATGTSGIVIASATTKNSTNTAAVTPTLMARAPTQ